MWSFLLDTIPTWVPIFLYSFDFLVILVMVFWDRKQPRSIMIWFLLFILAPVFGFVFYVLLGKGPQINRLRWAKIKVATDEKTREQTQEKNVKLYKDTSNNNEYHRINELITMNSNNGFPCTVNNKCEYFVDANDMYKKQLEDIKNAKNSINMMYYIFKKDAAGKMFLNALVEKQKEGVQVTVLYDSAANRFLHHFLRPLKKAGGHIESFFGTKNLIFDLLNSSYRNHRKITVIDGKIAYVGGMNIGVDYMGQDKRIKPWRDTSMRIEGDAVSMLQTRFFQDLLSNNSKASNKDLEQIMNQKDVFYPKHEEVGNTPIQIVSSGPDTQKEEIKLTYQKMISLARKEIYLESPYFVPDKSFIDSVILAQKSGIQVHLIIPGVRDHIMVYYVTLSNLQQLLDAGVRVYTYNGFIHSKMVVADELVASIGSANLDERSFGLNFEVNAVIYDKNDVIKCKEMALKDIENSVEIDREKFRNRSKLLKLKENFFRILSPIM